MQADHMHMQMEPVHVQKKGGSCSCAHGNCPHEAGGNYLHTEVGTDAAGQVQEQVHVWVPVHTQESVHKQVPH